MLSCRAGFKVSKHKTSLLPSPRQASLQHYVSSAEPTGKDSMDKPGSVCTAEAAVTHSQGLRHHICWSGLAMLRS